MTAIPYWKLEIEQGSELLVSKYRKPIFSCSAPITCAVGSSINQKKRMSAYKSLDLNSRELNMVQGLSHVACGAGELSE